MHYLKCEVLVSLWTLFHVKGDHWYSATVVDRFDQDEHIEADATYRKMFSFNNENESRPVLPIRKKGQINVQYYNNDFKGVGRLSPRINEDVSEKMKNNTKLHGSSEKIVDSHHNPINTLRKPIETISYNNSFDVINIIKKTKPKRKIVKIRCPNLNFRKNKKFDTNHAPGARFLEVFQVVEFEHVVCISSSGLEGTCLHEYECQSTGGSMMGTCADGYGICCVTQFLCDTESSAPTGWFTNPGFPSPSQERLSCIFSIKKASADITQIRLDFAAFELIGPTGGTCQQDQFVVSGQNTNSIIPILCGINTGQHVYIEVGDTDGPINLSVQTYTAENRLFAIKVTQMTGTDDLAAPTGCLQYYTDTEGALESFNYRDKSEIGIPRTSTYLNNLNYAICIRRSKKTCSVTYSNNDHMEIVNYDPDGLPVIPQGQAGVEIFNCPSDWLLISATRLCGDRLNDGSILQDFSFDAPVTDSSSGPITIWFRSDEGYTGRGFSLFYKQNACNG